MFASARTVFSCCIAGGLMLSIAPSVSAIELQTTPVEMQAATAEEAALRQASDQFYTALNSMFMGNMAQMTEIWSHAADITNMGPFGGRLMGWDAVRKQFEREAKMKLGG